MHGIIVIGMRGVLDRKNHFLAEIGGFHRQVHQGQHPVKPISSWA